MSGTPSIFELATSLFTAARVVVQKTLPQAFGAQAAQLEKGGRATSTCKRGRFGHHARRALMASALMGIAALQPATGQTFAIHDLGTLPGGNDSYATAINDRGQVVGQASIAPPGGPDPHVFLFEHGVMTDFITLRGVEANGINERGQVVGSANPATHPGRFAYLYQDGAVTDLGTLPGYTDSEALGINSNGQVVGFLSHGRGRHQFRSAFLYRNGVMTDLGALLNPDQISVATAINNRGQVVGYLGNSALGLEHAFLFDNGVTTDLGTLPGGRTSDASAINNRGDVVGTASTATGTHAFLYKDGVMTDLGTLGGSISEATGINNRGEVVGVSTTATGDWHAFFYRDGVMTDLGTLPGHIGSFAAGINERGEVAGSSYGVGTGQRAVLWTR
ncbi:DUF3466 family protein [Burkholderia ubonensis]|nr:DUF3466 family protein [Burkholderia ubonensis]MDY7787485.1 DUF3466 family protein [Burkholderia ubonensis]